MKSLPLAAALLAAFSAISCGSRTEYPPGGSRAETPDWSYSPRLDQSPFPEAWRWRELHGDIAQVERVALSSKHDVDGRQDTLDHEVYTFDDAGRAVEFVKLLGADTPVNEPTVARYTYDSAGRLAKTVGFALTRRRASSGEVTDTSLVDSVDYRYDFDRRGRLIRGVGIMDRGTPFSRASYAYDSVGRIVSFVYDSGEGRSEQITCTRRADDTMTLTSMTTMAGKPPRRSWVITVAPDGRPVRREVYHPGSGALLTEFYTDGRLTSYTTARGKGREMIEHTYTYDLDSRGNWVTRYNDVKDPVERRTITYNY